MSYWAEEGEQRWRLSPAERRSSGMLRHEAKRLKATAWHESGHALGAYVLDIPLAGRGISIIEDEDSWGRCWAILWPNPRPGVPIGVCQRDRCRVQCVYRLCGPPASLKAWGLKEGEGKPPNHASHSRGDEANTEEALRLTFGQSEEDRAADIEYLRVVASALIEAEVVQPALAALAQKLLAKKELKRHQILTILRRTLTEEDRGQLCHNIESLVACTDRVRTAGETTEEGGIS